MCLENTRTEVMGEEVHRVDCGEDMSQGRLKGKLIHLGCCWPKSSREDFQELGPG